MDLGLAGRAAVVAASSRGLGRATARALAAEGARVALCGRDPGRVAEAADAIARETKARTLAVVADVASADDCRRFVEAAAAVLSNAFRPAIAGLAKTLANELGKDGILVNTLCPGYTRTDRLQELAEVRSQKAGTTPEQVLDDLAAGVPLGRVGTPEEFAAVAAFLCSERASFVSGATIPVDGGACKGLL